MIEHAEKVSLGVNKFKEAVSAYLDKDFSLFEKISNEVIKIENEADGIKGNTRNHLHRGIFMPVDRGDFLVCLKEQDAILDACEDAVIWMQFRESKIENDLKKEDFEQPDLHVTEGTMVSVLGTSLQNVDVLDYFLKSSMQFHEHHLLDL